MSAVHESIYPKRPLAPIDQDEFVVLHGVDWKTYSALRERELPLSGYGSTTFRNAAAERGLEPDECYVYARDLASDDDYLDIALEVIVSNPGLDKLEVYRGLGVREVWVWRAGQFSSFILTGSGYALRERSELVPSLDFSELAQFADDADQLRALKGYRETLRSRA